MDYGAALREVRLSSVWRTDDFGRLAAVIEGSERRHRSDSPAVRAAAAAILGSERKP